MWMSLMGGEAWPVVRLSSWVVHTAADFLLFGVVLG